MNRRLSLVCDEKLADRVEALAKEYELSEQEVLRQVIQVGLEQLDD